MVDLTTLALCLVLLVLGWKMLTRSRITRLSREEYAKMVMVVRSDLGMGKGKIAAQCCHACLGAYKRAANGDESFYMERYGNTKIVLKVDSEQQLIDLHAQAEAEGIPACLIRDAGRTQIPEGSLTALGLGPSSEEKLARLTGKLKLL
jgi:PTH2 family peptidyl-tRNA hydrolase